MSDEQTEILSAFVDGETVDPRKLAEALQAPGALNSLQQFAELRAGVQGMQDRPGKKFYAAMEHVISPARAREPWWRRAVPIPAPVLAAAAVAAVALFAWLGTLGPSTTDLAGKPPQPDRIVHFEPGVDWKFQNNAPQSRNRRIEDEKLDVPTDPYRRSRIAFALAGADYLAGRLAAGRKCDVALLERRRRSHGDG